jgi:hypothetical protein
MAYSFFGKEKTTAEIGGTFPQHLLRACLTSGNGAPGKNRKRLAVFYLQIVSLDFLPLERASVAWCVLLPIDLSLPLLRQKGVEKMPVASDSCLTDFLLIA